MQTPSTQEEQGHFHFTHKHWILQVWPSWWFDHEEEVCPKDVASGAFCEPEDYQDGVAEGLEMILKMKFGTILEKLEFLEEPGFLPPRCRRAVRKGMGMLDARAIVKTGRRFISRFSFVDSYAIFLANFVARGGSFGVLILK